ncbi:hypothetical protein [Sebaldella sp. S0638]|uniref:hypothetical protein n=1 Tax=Sebaldella sp. S0638 TaxID=2957809 RepID=UPI0020A0090F|nr:hypothetical protein [Sebaldella sp. S0638]MCP1225713.1 hypothetical protein [Sebaldella sp. S0638]
MLKEINILGKIYKIKYVKKINNDSDQFGEIDYLKQVIKIRKDCSPEYQESTLLHEIIHGILEQLGFDEENKNEHLICSLETGLYQVLKENSIFSF